MKIIYSSLRVRLLLLVFVAVLPALLLTFYTGREQYQHAEQEALENALQLTEFAASKNEQLIEDTRVILISLSHAMDIGGVGLQGCGHLLNHLKDVHFPFYSAFYVADLEGNILCSMPDGDLPEDLPGCPHYLKLVAEDDFVISEYHICRNTGKGVISMGYPIWASDDEKIGVINVGIDLMWFNEFARDAALPPGSTLTVFDRDGVVLARYPDPDRWVGETMPEGAMHELVFKQKSGTARGVDIDDVERLYAYLPLTGSEESVFIMLGIPTDTAFAAVERMVTRNLLLIGFVMILTLAAAWFLSDAFVARQIKHLVNITQRLANGDLSARTQGDYESGEFGILNKAVDEMAQALAEREVEREQAEAEIREHTINLELSNRDLMDFANITSHDLQEPLRKISTFADLLNVRYAGQFDEQGKNYVNRIQTSAKHMQALIIDLLTYSRISTKSQPLDEVDMNPILDQVLIDLELKIEESNAEMHIQDLPIVQADPSQMRQLFFNLISNSLKFKKSNRPPKIVVKTESTSSSSDYQKIVVSDNGIGIDEKYQDRIFQPFQRLHSNTEFEGTGMGLAICRKIVERHGGDICIHSQPGEGATFVIKIPKAGGTNA